MVVVWGFAGCTSENTKAATSSAPTMPSTTSAPTKPAAIAYINAACRRFFSLDPLEADGETSADIRRFARRRQGAVNEALRALKGLRLPPADLALGTQVDTGLRSAQSAIGQLVDLPATAVHATAAQIAVAASSQEQLGIVAITLVQYGAKSCLPTDVEPPDPSPANAAPFLEVRPEIVIPVGDALSNNFFIVADDSGAFVVMRRSREVVMIDAATNTIRWRTSLGASRPERIVLDRDRVWVRADDRWLLVRKTDGHIVRTFAATPYASTTETFYPAVAATDGVWECNGTNLFHFDRELGPDRSLPIAPGCASLDISNNESIVVLTREPRRAEFRVILVDPIVGRVVKESPIPKATGEHLLFSLDDGTNVSVGRQAIGVLHGDRDTGVVKTLSRTGKPGDGCANGTVVWVSYPDERRVLRIDTATMDANEFLAGPGAIGVGCTADTVWVTNSDDGTVMRFNVKTWPPAKA